ncbi:ABC transporter ATP-binding protein [Oceaniglobus trochenteri]|uniref:ABC transporter ATP-binding protein n=1 Tax=Oceaniglobus trochenteri TaxID=2763260 RepID=UPI001CFF6331|nr:sn-glycerol-3-phosphate ABC transporter ATP-binding protein UgpC [Oceaniglobus trochenteri]
MAQLQLSEVRKSFGAVDVIKGVDIDVRDGEFVVLVGPSGCGKSTLLRMIAGLETVTSGSIRIGEREVKNLRAKERDIAMVFQSYALYPHMTVARNMGFALKLQGIPKDEIAKRVNDAAAILNLTDYLERYPKQLSGGQRQRVAMGRAIVRNPRVFLFDEPLSNLDAKLRVQMRAEIKQLHQRLGNTIIYVTHDQIEAMTMADKIVILSGGAVEQVGSPLELYDRPRNTFVAGFIGSPAMNLLEGRIGAGGMIELAGGGTLPLPVDVASPPKGGVIVGIRPEHMLLGGAGQGDLPLRIDVLEPTGSETHVMGKAGSVEVVAVVRDRLSERPGETLHLSVDPKHVHLFDAASGLRIAE